MTLQQRKFSMESFFFEVFTSGETKFPHLEPRIVLVGHEGDVNCVTFSVPFVITGSDDKTVRLWDVESGDCIRVLTGTRDKVWCVEADRHRQEFIEKLDKKLT